METTVEDKLLQFIKDCWENQYSLEILLFLGKHPSTQFNQTVIVRGTTGHRLDMERATRTLIKRGLLKVTYINDSPFYSLTSDEPLRSLVLKLVGLNRYQLQLTLNRILQKSDSLTILPATA